ncbi:hypothetical protein FHL15_007422 [Xylaria flabelliformis]|uniref:Cytochrome P450 n=1 Tax=Xylaria flabelliformis TaxID=2512241 RepID=A0A553HUK5_9PEZI|nr:hypothetical protein FHL15_007422 [Xylaria flabelliformis]
MGWVHDELVGNIRVRITSSTQRHDPLMGLVKNNKEDRKNLIGYVIRDAIENGGIKKNWNFVLGDFALAVAAGSDPVRQVLANLVYYIIQHPARPEYVRKELESIDINKYKALQSLSHINACIYETLRPNPAVPSAGLRIPPKGDESCFLKPDEWIPEGLTTRPELVLNKNAFVAWSIGKVAVTLIADETMEIGVDSWCL